MLRQAETRLKSELPDRDKQPVQVPRKERSSNISHKETSRTQKRIIPNTENFMPNAANDTLPRKEPSTCASGNQTEKGYVGVFIKNNTPNRVRFTNRLIPRSL
jgi:hypothetical protein